MFIDSLIQIIKKHPRLKKFLSLFLHRGMIAEALLRIITPFPKLHCSFLIKHSFLYGYGTLYPRTMHVDLDNPTLFNEKMLWLKYYRYNKDPLVAQCYDKFLVRQYVEDCGCGEILNTLYGVWDNVDDIPWDDLPPEFVLKKTNGCGNHVFRREGIPFDSRLAKKTLKHSSYRERQRFRATGDLFALKEPQRFICEKLLYPENGFERVDDYKFFCFNGEPLYLNYIWNRSDSDKNSYRETFKRIVCTEDSFELVDKSSLIAHAENIDIIIPSSCLKEMVEVCRKLSKPFPCVRVDLYNQNGSVVFGELTFTSEGSHVLHHVFKADNSINLDGLSELGDLIKL